MREKILYSLNQGKQALHFLSQDAQLVKIEMGVLLLSACFKEGNKVLIAGNGGSLCDAAHFAEELTGFFRSIRPALPAISLSEPGHLTCVANDLGFDHVFSRGIEAYGKPGDVFIALSTSGNSSNILHALMKAKELGLSTMSFLGKAGGQAKGMADWELVLENFTTSDRIQEAHMIAMHIMIELIEEILFKGDEAFISKESLAAVSC